jgi:hypothetical protein
MAPVPGWIFIKREVLGWSRDRRTAILAHEVVHQQQMKRDGYFRWLWRYLFNGRWRVTYELEAYTENIAFLADKGVVSHTLGEYYVDLVLTRYFPKYWPFGRKKPTADQGISILKSFIDAYNKD